MSTPLLESEVMDVVARVETGALTATAVPRPLGELVEALVSNQWAFYLAPEEGEWLIDSVQRGDGAELSDEAIRGEGPVPPLPLLAERRITTAEARARWNLLPLTSPGGIA